MTDKRKNTFTDNDKKSLRTEDPAANPSQENAGFDEIPDLDGDGMIGHTGGNFGDTTYTGGSLIQPQPGPVEDAPEAGDEDIEEEK